MFYRDYACPQIRWLVGKMTTVVKDRTYVRGSVVPFEEDLEHEFKGHRTISLQDRWIFLTSNNLYPCSKAASWDEASPQWQPGRAGEYAATVVEIHLRDDQLGCWRGAVRGDL